MSGDLLCIYRLSSKFSSQAKSFKPQSTPLHLTHLTDFTCSAVCMRRRDEQRPRHDTLAQHHSTPNTLLLGTYFDWECTWEGAVCTPPVAKHRITFGIILRWYIPSGTMTISMIHWCSSTRESCILLAFKEKASLDLLSQHPDFRSCLRSLVRNKPKQTNSWCLAKSRLVRRHKKQYQHVFSANE